MRHAVTAALAMVLAATLPAAPATAKFSISGKNGQIFLAKQVDPAKLAASDQVMAADTGEGRGFSEMSINRGALRGEALAMPRVEALLNAMLEDIRAKWIDGGSGGWKLRDPGVIKVRITATTHFTASAQPDRVILMPFGTLQRATSDDALYFLLAHEFAHIGLTHFARDAKKEKSRRDIGEALRLAYQAFQLSQLKVRKVGSKYDLYQANDPAAKAQLEMAWASRREVTTFTNLLNQGMAKDEEDQADAAAYDLSRLAGYSPDGLAFTLQQIGIDEQQLAKEARALFEKDLQKSLMPSNEQLEQVKGGKIDLDGWLSRVGGNMLQLGLGQLGKAAAVQHRSAEERQTGLVQYSEAAWPLAENDPSPRRLLLDRLRAEAEYKEAVVAVKALQDCKLAMQKADYAGADRAIAPALQTRYRYAPAIANVAGRIFHDLKNYPASEEWYNRAERPPPASFETAPVAKRGGKTKGKAKPAPAPAPAASVARDYYTSQNYEGYQAHVAMLIEAGNFKRAREVIASGTAAMGDEEFFLPQLLKLAFIANDEAEFVRLLDRCAKSAAPSIRNGCRYAVFTPETMAALDKLAPADRAMVDDALDRFYDNANSGDGLLDKVFQTKKKPAA